VVLSLHGYEVTFLIRNLQIDPRDLSTSTHRVAGTVPQKARSPWIESAVYCFHSSAGVNGWSYNSASSYMTSRHALAEIFIYIITITIIIIYLTASGLSPGGSGYYAHT
jgi:hypothetical protein